MAGLWELENVTYRIDGRALVDGASLRVAPGAFTGVLGPNGAGKSTLLRLAAGLISPDTGRVVLDGKPLDRYSRRQAAQHIAFVPQDTHIEFDFTAYQIALMGRNPWLGRFQAPGRKDREAVRRAMEWTGVADLGSRLVTTLSGGERQRVFLARALAGESPFIALDEPTANLDIEHALDFLNLAKELTRAEGRGILMAVHDLNWAHAFCDEIVVLDDGRIAGRGTPDKTLTPERIREVFRVEAEPLRSSGGQVYFAFTKPSGASLNREDDSESCE